MLTLKCTQFVNLEIGNLEFKNSESIEGKNEKNIENTDIKILGLVLGIEYQNLEI